MKKLFHTTLLGVCLFVNVHAQIGISPHTILSPEVSSLAKEVQTPVSLSSGTVTIQIPLYTIKAGDITIPVSLSYDGSGILVASQPSWVGQNWTLKAGGMVTRIVNGLPDEFDNVYAGGRSSEPSFDTPVPEHIGYYTNRKTLAIDAWDTTEKIRNIAQTGMYDLEPDEFIFNFCGHTGKFYLNEKCEFVCTDSRYKIEFQTMLMPLYSNNRDTYMGPYAIISDRIQDGYVRVKYTHILGFRITDPDGIVYYFGAYDKDSEPSFGDPLPEIEKSAKLYAKFHLEEYRAWHLVKIVSPRGYEVDFTYESGDPLLNIVEQYTDFYFSSWSKKRWGLTGGLTGIETSYNGYTNTGSTMILPSYLKEIKTPFELVQFSRSPSNALNGDFTSWAKSYSEYFLNQELTSADGWHIGWNDNINYTARPIRLFQKGSYQLAVDLTKVKSYKLDSISVFSTYTEAEIKKYSFTYQEKLSVQGGEPKPRRLQLEKIIESAGGEDLPPIMLKYRGGTLPITGFTECVYDHWGYYNGIDNPVNKFLSIGSTAYSLKREPDSSAVRSGLLEEIVYPTGGFKRIAYEPNYYNRVVQRNNIGEFSIADQSSTKVGGGLRVREIIEYDGITTSTTRYDYDPGILNGEIKYSWYGLKRKMMDGTTSTENRYFTHTILPVSRNAEGGMVSYSKVTETRPGNGHIEYTFINHDTHPDLNSITLTDMVTGNPTPMISRVIERGKLLEKRVYAEEGDAPIMTETYQYAPLNNKYVDALYYKRLDFGKDKITLQYDTYEASAYKIYYYPNNIVKKTEYYLYPSGNTVQNETRYVYDRYNQLSSETKESDSELVTTTLKYPYDYSAGIYQRMVKDNSFSPVVEKITARNGVEIERVKAEYSNVAEDQSPSTPGNYVPTSIKNSFAGENALREINRCQYDKRGNVIQVTDQNGVSISYVWGYKGQYIVAEVQNATIDDLTAIPGLNGIRTSPIDRELTSDLIGALRALNQAQAKIYTYDPLVGVKSITDPSGRTLYYHYDDHGRLDTIRDDQGGLVEEYEYHYEHHYENQ